MEGKLCLTRCEDSSAQRHSETSCCLFLTNRDIPVVWPGQIYDVPPARVDGPCPHTVSFVCLVPCLFGCCYFISGHIVHPGSFWCSSDWRSLKWLLHAYLSKGRTGILNTRSSLIIAKVLHQRLQLSISWIRPAFTHSALCVLAIAQRGVCLRFRPLASGPLQQRDHSERDPSRGGSWLTPFSVASNVGFSHKSLLPLREKARGRKVIF